MRTEPVLKYHARPVPGPVGAGVGSLPVEAPCAEMKKSFARARLSRAALALGNKARALQRGALRPGGVIPFRWPQRWRANHPPDVRAREGWL
jgi:hypothetical protein